MKKWLIALFLGCLLPLAFAPYGLFPIAILAPAGLLALILREPPTRAAWLGFIFGIGYFGMGVSWVYISINTYGNVPMIGAAFLTFGLVCLMALYPAFTCYITNRFFPFTATNRFNFAFPAVWVFSEWLRTILFTGFPWLILGYSQLNSPLKGYAPLFSVFGVSLAMVLISTLLVYSYLDYKQRDKQTCYQHLFIIAAILILGGALTLIPWTRPNGNATSVSLVQGNIPQSLKWSPEHLKLSLDRYETLTEPLWGKSQLIVWPEAAVPLTFQNAMPFITLMNNKARETGTTLILGIPVQNEAKDGYFNAIVSLGKTHRLYAKRLLVPFGEYIPFQKQLARAFDFMQIPIANMKSGAMSQAPMMVGDVKILPSICYEITFPDLSRSSDKSLGLLLTVTNDAWFGRSNAQAQHLEMAGMRAVEMGRPVLFVSNDGITAILNPSGKIESQVPTHEPAVLTSTVQPTRGITPWMFNGSDPILVILIGLLIGARYAARKQTAENATNAFPAPKL